MTVGIVGCGSIAQVHARCVASMNDHRLVAFADTKPERARAMAEEFGGTPYACMEELIESARPDIIHICTPHSLHAPMALSALARGIHVFMEKPPVIDEWQYEQLRNAVMGDAHSDADHAPIGQASYGPSVGANPTSRLGFCFQNRYNPSVVQVREYLASGSAGAIRGARGFVTWNRGEAYYAESDWRGRIATEGGGALINQSIHTLDLLNYLVGRPPLGVDAMMANHHLKGVVEVEDTISARIGYAGATVCFYATTAYSSIGNRAFQLEFGGVESTIRLMLATYQSARTGQYVPI